MRRALIACTPLIASPALADQPPIAAPPIVEQPAPAIMPEGTAIAIDGNTLDFNGRRVRIIGFDAPEMKSDPRGPKARAAMDDLIRGKIVACRVEGLDKYRGDLATCRTLDPDRDLTTEMLRAGQGTHYRHYTIGRPEFADWNEAENEARAARRGIWAGEPPPPATQDAPLTVEQRTVIAAERQAVAAEAGVMANWAAAIGAILAAAVAVGIALRQEKVARAEQRERERIQRIGIARPLAKAVRIIRAELYAHRTAYLDDIDAKTPGVDVGQFRDLKSIERPAPFPDAWRYVALFDNALAENILHLAASLDLLQGRAALTQDFFERYQDAMSQDPDAAREWASVYERLLPPLIAMVNECIDLADEVYNALAEIWRHGGGASVKPDRDPPGPPTSSAKA